MDPLKGGFVRAPRRGDANESLTPAEEAAAKIKPPKVLPTATMILVFERKFTVPVSSRLPHCCSGTPFSTAG